MPLQEFVTRAVDLFYIRPVAALIPRQTFRYALCGAANVGLSWVCYFAVYHYLLGRGELRQGPVVVSAHIAAMLLVFPVIFLTGFWLNRHVAFRRSPLPRGVQLVRYGCSVAGSVAVNYGCLKLFVDLLGCWATPSQMMASGVTFIYSYVAAKYFSFRHAEE